MWFQTLEEAWLERFQVSTGWWFVIKRLSSKSVSAERETSNIHALAQRLGADWVDNHTQMVWVCVWSHRKTKTHSHTLCRVWPHISQLFILSDYIHCYHYKGQNQHFVCFQSSEALQQQSGCVCGGVAWAQGCFSEGFTENRLKQVEHMQKWRKSGNDTKEKFRKYLIVHFPSPLQCEGHAEFVICTQQIITLINLLIHQILFAILQVVLQLVLSCF